MFTGLVEEVGRIAAVEGGGDGARLRITAPRVSDGLGVGDSVAVAGACLTAVAAGGGAFDVDVVAETLARTTLGGRAAGDPVNLERALVAGARLGGHIVQGHVDGVGTVTALAAEGQGMRLGVAAPGEILRYVVHKGSVTVDGVSLTVAARGDGGFEVALVPHTLRETTLGALVPGASVNLEVDLVAKYVEALVAPYRTEGSR